MQVSLLTTTDNPFDPFDQWDQWYMWDEFHGYQTTGLLARIAVVSNELSETDQERAIALAIDEIVDINASGVHTKVTREMKQAS